MLTADTTTGPMLIEVSEAHSDVPFTVVYVPGNGMELSLAQLKEPEDDEKNPDLCGNIHAALHPHGAKTLFAPTPTKANTEIIEPTKLTSVFRLGKGMRMFRNYEKPADGSFLRNPGDTGIFSASGCGLIVATMGDRFVFAHAARDSLIDRGRILTGTCSRQHESVIDSIIAAFRDFGFENIDIKTRMQVWLFYFIRPEDLRDSYDHPEHGPYNYKVGRDVRDNLGLRMYDDAAREIMLDLPVIAEAQFISQGISTRRIHLEHCYLPEGMPHTRNGGSRSLLAIIRR